jgi:energy-coupling factor transport system ATP-binding protein
MSEPALVVEDYSFWFKATGGRRILALEDVNFAIEQGDFVLILGPSGSGKSTLALNLVGVYPDFYGGYNQGRILVNHSEKGLINRRELDRGQRCKTVNMLFQNPEDQIVTLTVEEEVGFALENYLVPANEIHPLIDHALDLVGLKGFRDRSTLKLSGGEKQRVALAAMLAMRPNVLILDEPTSNLDPVGTHEVLDAVEDVRSRVDITMMIVEHEVDEVFHEVDKVLCVDGHRVEGPFSPRQFMDQRGIDVREEMGLWIPQASEVALVLRARNIHLPGPPLDGAELIAAVKTHAPAVRLPFEVQSAGASPSSSQTSPAHAREVVISVKNLGFSYPTKPDVLKGIDVDIKKNELLAIVGQNGSGKSTLAATLNGILKPTSGEVIVEGRPTTSYKFAELAKRVAYIFQVPEKQFVKNVVYEEMAHGLQMMGMAEAEVKGRVQEVLENVNLEERKEISPYLLSHGQKRRLSVACMVISDPDVVILDEPTFGQDWLHAMRLMEYLRTLSDQGAAVTFITHDMRLVAQFADRVVAMSDGTVIFDGTPSDLFASDEVLRQASLKRPPVFEFSRELLGSSYIQTTDVIDALEVSLGRSGSVVQSG